MDKNIEKKLNTLSPREQRVVRMKTGLGMNTKYSLKEIGLQYSESADQIQKRLNRAMQKLKG
jgi:RNA polymerase primary sigma factor